MPFNKSEGCFWAWAKNPNLFLESRSWAHLECTWFKQYHSQSLAGIWTCEWFRGQNFNKKWLLPTSHSILRLVDWQNHIGNIITTLRTESLSAGGPVSQAAEKHLANPPSPITSFTWIGHISTFPDQMISRPGKHPLQWPACCQVWYRASLDQQGWRSQGMLWDGDSPTDISCFRHWA